MGKLYHGNPEAKDGWGMFGEKSKCDGVDWVVLHKMHEKGFLNFKVAACGKVENKANYWFSFKIKNQAFFGRDFLIMRSNRPELSDFVENKINEILELSKIKEVVNDAA
jgi:hypothetical protein